MSNRNSGMSWIPWWLIVLLFFFFPPGGVILLLMKLFARGKSRQDSAPYLVAEPQIRQRVDTRIHTTSYQQSRRGQTAEPSVAPDKVKKTRTRWMKILGGILIFLGAAQLDFSTFYWREFFSALEFLVAGGALFFKGWLTDQEQKRFANYQRIMGERGAVPIDELARIAGISPKKAAKDLQNMIDSGYFGDTAYLNRELGYLFRSSEADQEWQEKQREMEESAPAEANEGYSGILRNIRRANDRIADPELSAKIDQLENITARIFRAVEADPDKAKQIDRFLNYYLPTTQKLLDSYAEFESAGVEGENLRQAKERIASTMDMILNGFSHQLDELYKVDALDVDSDIRVMETMLRRDTSSAADDFGLGQNRNFSSGQHNDFGSGQNNNFGLGQQ